jgi:hypothetical protein
MLPYSPQANSCEQLMGSTGIPSAYGALVSEAKPRQTQPKPVQQHRICRGQIQAKHTSAASQCDLAATAGTTDPIVISWHVGKQMSRALAQTKHHAGVT